jgi:hypothetical protein
MNDELATVRRLAPPDRRSPIKVGVRACALGPGCVCCPGYLIGKGYKRHANCRLDHPAEDRLCSPPYPENISACPERERTEFPQAPLPAAEGFTPPGLACCVECGRVTGRRWTDPDGRLLPWCAGKLPAPPEPEPEPLPGRRRPKYNPALRRHSWTKTSEHWKNCVWCGIRVNNRPDPHSPAWFQEWDWPAQTDREGGDNYRGGKVPDCPGPASKES